MLNLIALCIVSKGIIIVKLSLIIEELVEERGLQRDLLSDIICESMLVAYKKKYPDIDISVVHNKKTDELDILANKKVVTAVENEDLEISIRKAKNIDSSLSLGDFVKVPFEKPIGRIEILKAKQLIAQKIRTIEALAVFEEYSDKAGSILVGTIHKCERVGMTVKVGDALAFLPKSLSIPTDKCVVGFTIRGLLKDVLREPKNDNQLILERVSPLFIQKLFELEFPEVYEKLVEIKKIARIPGYKTKIAVASNDKNIDPVGTCIGVGGVRIQPILKELGGEKIDVVGWTPSKEALIKVSLKPAVVNRVELIDDGHAKVWVDEDQRSLAIGKMGQNIALASQLADINIELVSDESVKKESFTFDDEEVEIGE